MTQYSQLRGLKLLSLTCIVLLGAWGAPQVVAQTVETPVITSTALPVGTTTNLAIPPSGITVTVACDTADTIRYTLDGSEPKQTSSLYTGPVFIAEQLGLTDTKTVAFKAKGFAAGMTESATASASFTNYAEPEFTMQFQLVGVTDQQTLLKLGLATGATDEMDADHDFAVASTEPPTVGDDGMPPLPGEAVRSVTPGKDFLVTDYRSRSKLKEWPLYVASKVTTTEITLKWGNVAVPSLPVPVAAYLHLLVDTDGDGTDDLDFDLTGVGGQVTLTKKYSPFLVGVAPNQFLTSRCRVVYQNNQGTLNAAIGPLAATQADPPAQWAYRPASGGAFSAWQAADATVTGLHSGNYEVKFSPVTATDPNTGLPLYTPPGQIVSVVAGETTTVTATYTDKAATATMAVAPTYDTATKTVKVDCAFTYTPQVAMAQVTWVFDVPEGWTITAISGLTADWSYEIQADGRTVIFTYTPAIRGTVSSNSFEFMADLKYDGAGEPESVLVGVTSVQGAPDGGGDPVDSDPPVAQTSTLRTATLDVDGVNGVNSLDALFVYRKIMVYDFNAPYGTLEDIVPNSALLPEGVTAQTVLDNITALGNDLDVDGVNGVTSLDALFIYRKIMVYNFNAPYGTVDDIVPNAALLPEGVTAEQVKANIELIEQ